MPAFRRSHQIDDNPYGGSQDVVQMSANEKRPLVLHQIGAKLMSVY
jgi:hypothetical protein